MGWASWKSCSKSLEKACSEDWVKFPEKVVVAGVGHWGWVGFIWTEQRDSSEREQHNQRLVPENRIISIWLPVTVWGGRWGQIGKSLWVPHHPSSVLVLGVSKISGREKLILAHTAFSKLSMGKKAVYVPVISGVILWGQLRNSPGSGDVTVHLTHRRPCLFLDSWTGCFILWVEVESGWATLVWIPVDPLKELPG